MTTFMPPQRPAHTSSDTSTMSLAILPSHPMAYSEPSVPARLRSSPSSAKRPKLSLDTANVPSIFGNRSTSLRLDTLSATSPTSRNTFRNALDPAPSQNKKSVNAVRTPPTISIDVVPQHQPALQPPYTNESASSSATTATSVSSIDSLFTGVPYKLAFNTTSILVNSPLPRPRRSLFGHSRPMFPASKKVAFREPLTEDVKTTRFTLRHSDIESSTSTISTLELTPSDSQAADRTLESPEHQQPKEAEHQSTSTSPQTGDKRESSDEEDSDQDSCPATPVAGRRKRHRQWVWTLGSVDTDHDPSSQEQQEQNMADQTELEQCSIA